MARFVGVALFGLTSLGIYIPTQFWSEADFSWGPGAMALATLLLFSLHLALVWRRTAPLDPIVWLPLGLIFFYFGTPIAVEGIGRGLAFDYDPWRVGLPTNLARGYCGALLAFVTYLFGIHLAGVRDLSNVTAAASPDQSLALASVVLTVGALTMLAGGVALVGPSVLFGSYRDWWDAKRAGADPRFIEIGILFAQAGMFGVVASHHPRRRYRLYLAGFVALTLASVSIEKGSRATLMATAVGLFWCYTQRVRRLNAAFVTAVALTGVLLFPILAEYRVSKHVSGLEDVTLRGLFAKSIYDMGSSVSTLFHTMDLVPAEESYAWGIGYVESVFQLIPNVGLTAGDGYLTRSLKAHHSNWLTWQLSPGWAAVGGYGSSMAGELYFNFGVPGILLGCSLMGLLTGWLRNSSQDSTLKLVTSALFFGAMIIYVRNPIGVPLKEVTWSVAALLIIRGTLSLLTSRSASARVSRQVQL